MTRVYFFETEISGTKRDIKNAVSKTAKEKLLLLACDFLGTKPENIIFSYKENGKPFFENYPNFHFNISHSGTAFAIAISDRPVGIDIEKIRKPDLRVAKRFFTGEEMDYVNQNPKLRFFEIWTKREAFIKRYGLSLKDISKAEIKGIFTTEKQGFVISVSCDDQNIILNCD